MAVSMKNRGYSAIFMKDDCGRFPAALLLLAGLLSALWLLASAPSGWGDDLAYSRTMLPGQSEHDFFHCAGSPLSSFSQLPATWAAHYESVNGRAANMLAFLCSLLPSWLLFLLNTAAMSMMLLSLCRLARRVISPLLVVMMWGAVWLALPWQDTLCSQDFFINYVWSTALNLSLLSALLRGRSSRWLYLLAAFAAMMHEGMSAAIDAAMLLLLIRGRERAVALTYMLCSLVPLCSPGLWALAGHREAQEFAHNYFSHKMLTELLPVWVAFGVSLYNWLRHKNIDFTQVLIWVVIVAAVAVAIFSRQAGRAFWLPIALSLALTARGVHIMAGRRCRLMLTLGVALLMSGWCIYLSGWQFYLARERDEVTGLLRGGKTVVFADITAPDMLPWPLLGIPGSVGMNENCRNNIVASLHGDSIEAVAILPRSWQEAVLAQAPGRLPLIAGSAGVRGEDYLYLSEKPLREAVLTHSPQGRSVALNPLYALRQSFGSPALRQKVELECVELTPGLWSCRPLRLARSLLGRPVISVDTLER